MESRATSSTAINADDIRIAISPMEAAMFWIKAGVTSETGIPANFSLNTRKNTRKISCDRSKSQWNTRVCMVPAEVIRMTIAVRRLVCTNWIARIFAPRPLGVVDTAANRVAAASTRETPSSNFSGS